MVMKEVQFVVNRRREKEALWFWTSKFLSTGKCFGEFWAGHDCARPESADV